MSVFLFFILLCCSALDFAHKGEYLFFAYPKKSHQKKGYPTCTPCGCPAMLDWTGGMWTRCRSDSTSRHPRLILCFSASLNGRFLDQEIIRWPKIKKTSSSFWHASGRKPSFDSFWIGDLSCQVPLNRFWIGFWSYLPFSVVEHWRLRAESREDCLSDSEFHSARSKLKRTETPQANMVGWLFFCYLFFGQRQIRTERIWTAVGWPEGWRPGRPS